MRMYRRAIPIGLLTASAIALGIGVPSSSAFAASKTYDAVSQFSSANNPHGHWSYNLEGGPLGTKAKNICGIKKLNGWTNGAPEPDSASIVANKTAVPLACSSNSTVRIPADTINLDPEANPNVNVQFTVPKTGTYSIAGAFLGDDTAEAAHTVEIRVDGVGIYENTISNYGQRDAFNISAHLSVGAIVTFINDTVVWHNLSVGLQASLTS